MGPWKATGAILCPQAGSSLLTLCSPPGGQAPVVSSGLGLVHLCLVPTGAGHAHLASRPAHLIILDHAHVLILGHTHNPQGPPTPFTGLHLSSLRPTNFLMTGHAHLPKTPPTSIYGAIPIPTKPHPPHTRPRPPQHTGPLPPHQAPPTPSQAPPSSHEATPSSLEATPTSSRPGLCAARPARAGRPWPGAGAP